MVSSWLVVQSTWLKREFICPEREREGEFKREAFLKEQLENLREVKRGRGEVCPGYLTSAF